MSAPTIGRETLSLPDFSSVATLPKPIKAVVYLVMLSAMTVVTVGVLLAMIVIVGQLTGAFDVTAFL